MTGVEYEKEEFKSDATDPAGSWDTYLKERQGSVGLAFRADDFRSTAFAQSVGKLQIVKFTTSPLDYRRTARNIRADGDDHSYRLLVPLRGLFRFEQGDSREIFYPGKVGFFRWNEPLFMTHEQDISCLILTVPENSVDDKQAADAPLALDERRPLVRALDTQVRLLVETTGWTAADYSVQFSSALMQLNGVLNPYPEVKFSARATEAERARRLIEQHAHDSSVTPEVIAEILGISVSTLYRALKRAGYPSPGAILRTVRVERAHRRLSVALPVDMDRIAFDEGFSCTRSFREAYRAHYGQSPAQAREQLFG
ncbi:helix-turn-helix domain-containing protein [Nocardia sp. XZ_19_369]|uniref:helix-turn-helix domain-containing protein n=1 Tax=Nocardia sp. XZ_19_369 TaxID=2769487 RepID=UPI00188FC93C|nr:helix-turn-helix domain-containing protein [Nocardia sp. XZ_19_369]